MRIVISALSMASNAGVAKGGVSRYVYAIVEHMSLLGTTDEFVVIIPEDCESPAEWTSRSNIQVFQLTGKLAARKTTFDTFFAHRLAKKLKADVWFSTAHALPIFSKVPQVIVVHDLFAFTQPDEMTKRYQRVAGGALRLAIPRADKIVTVSNFTKSEILRMFKVSDELIVVTHLGPGNLQTPVPRSSVTPERLRQIGVPWDRFFFTISTIEPRKNLVRLMQAVDQLDESVGLAIAGAKGWKTSAIVETYENLKHKERIAFLGYVDDADVPVLFAGCEAAVVASISEGFGIPMVEAMIYGAPLVASRAGSLPEVGGNLPVYCDPFDVGSIRDALQAILKTPDLREGLVEAGKHQAAQFTWESAAEKTLQALHQAAESRR